MKVPLLKEYSSSEMNEMISSIFENARGMTQMSKGGEMLCISAELQKSVTSSFSRRSLHFLVLYCPIEKLRGPA
ncbi:Pentatricopeptide repeat superfamily protein [Prunus dulcis]|uniref:Pentatricopeptide repeat superfamily protein n=1 Tax=Prunus dulcis TaxID=3755 RepID=A0A4Y1R188_PRUDU|nr:Pentatricopeptide repeat superfamily protein [Prunus dulcis]